jgi:hypothetical protein
VSLCGGWVIVDVAGLKSNGDLYVVEAKATTSDMKRDLKSKKHARLVSTQQVDFIYYIIADGVDFDGLDTSIGIIDEYGRVVRRAKRKHTSKTDRMRRNEAMIFAKALSWRTYGHVIRREKQQYEFSM